ncbi:hypothetical protein EIP91_008989 [Steccherinum ochraceum]|uniref:Class II aldolase/adducin N-terminal domain-containing protein n=1 Tax=Steccherinum ochraceum TaxID=92696 RepID=A0A4R0R4X7_9APHY|nr:hypothetical protein EIP91_008989 [Steccherinum ochraceum]
MPGEISTKTQAQEEPIAIRGEIPRPPIFHDKYEEREWMKFRLAQAYRIFSHYKFDESIAGHITMRDNIRPDCFWVNPMGKHFSIIQPRDLLLVDHDGNIQEGSGPFRMLNGAAFVIHSKIHAARPDVMCAAHAHTTYGKAFAALGKELDMITQDHCVFYKDHAVYKSFGGVVLQEVEGERIAQTIGSKKAAILQNHGLLVATDSIEATVNYFIQLEKACEVQLIADSAAAATGQATLKIDDVEAASTHKTICQDTGGWFGGLPQFQALEARENVRFKFSTSVTVTNMPA